MHRVELNCATGEVSTIELTADEIAELENMPQTIEEPTPLTAAEKLEKLGLSISDLRELLGID